MRQPSTQIWNKISAMLGTDLATLRAVFEVEAAGIFFKSDGTLQRRFEPHHFPRAHWAGLGFAVRAGQAAWRASLALKTSVRRAMFSRAENIDAENAYKAASWGAPQIMGFNHTLAGYDSAGLMVDKFEDSADEQILGFFNFVENAGLTTHLRSQNWHAFAAGYNGNGQAAVYAGKIESAYRRHSGGRPSAVTLRIGSRGSSVLQLQENLLALGYALTADGSFGAQTRTVVRQFQEDNKLVVDGIAGAATQRAMLAAKPVAKTKPVPSNEFGSEPVKENPKPTLVVKEIEPPRAEADNTDEDNFVDKMIERGGAVVGAGGVTGLLTSLNENSQTIIIGGVVVGAVIVAVLWVMRKRETT